MWLQGQTVTHRIALFQQVWKRIKIAEWQAISEIADIAEMPFEDAEALLHQEPNLSGFMEAMRRMGCLDENVIDISKHEMTNQVLLMTSKGFAWGEMDEEPVNRVLEMF